ncbi:hypothetical protein DFH06DRAFT_1125090 [Mycena polygramma]|nr:hypothetical protein DFH06DRAFT_1125090 [Mycena polygramma]
MGWNGLAFLLARDPVQKFRRFHELIQNPVMVHLAIVMLNFEYSRVGGAVQWLNGFRNNGHLWAADSAIPPILLIALHDINSKPCTVVAYETILSDWIRIHWQCGAGRVNGPKGLADLAALTGFDRS